MPGTTDSQGTNDRTRPQRIQSLLLALFLLGLLVCLFQVLGIVPGAHGRFTDGLMVALTAAITFAWLVAQLPLQNVLAVSGFLALLFAAAQSMRGVLMLQPSTFAREIGPQLGGAVPLVLVLLWVLALLNSRGTAKVLLRSWRANSAYGFLLIGCSAILFTVFELALEAYAAGLKSYWAWERLPSSQHMLVAPGSNSLFWFLLSLASQVVVAPWWINKKPIEPPPTLSPLLLWAALTIFLSIGAAVAHCWIVAVLVWLTVAFVAGWALIGARLIRPQPTSTQTA